MRRYRRWIPTDYLGSIPRVQPGASLAGNESFDASSTISAILTSSLLTTVSSGGSVAAWLAMRCFANAPGIGSRFDSLVMTSLGRPAAGSRHSAFRDSTRCVPRAVLEHDEIHVDRRRDRGLIELGSHSLTLKLCAERIAPRFRERLRLDGPHDRCVLLPARLD